MVHHWEAWDKPSQEQIKEYLDSLDLDKELEPQIIDEIAAGVMHNMLSEDPEGYLERAYPNGTPELLKELANIIPSLTGDALARAAKLGYLVEGNEKMLEDMMKMGGKETVQEYLKEEAQSLEERMPGNCVGGDSHNGNWMGTKITSAPKRLKSSGILEKILKLLEWEAFQATQSENWVEDDEGDRTKDVVMENIGDISKLPRVDLVKYADDDHFLMEFVQGNVYYPVNIDREKLTEDLVVLIDDSGSMCNVEKIAWVKALIIALFEKVVHNDACLYIAMFETFISPFIKISTVKERDEFLDKFYGGHGGTTDIENSLTLAVSQIKSKQLAANGGTFFELKGDQVKIIIINDGADHIDLSFDPHHTTHVVTLFQANYNLGQVSLRSGGTALMVDYGDNLLDYNEIKASIYNADDYDDE